MSRVPDAILWVIVASDILLVGLGQFAIYERLPLQSIDGGAFTFSYAVTSALTIARELFSFIGLVIFVFFGVTLFDVNVRLREILRFTAGAWSIVMLSSLLIFAIIAGQPLDPGLDAAAAAQKLAANPLLVCAGWIKAASIVLGSLSVGAWLWKESGVPARISFMLPGAFLSLEAVLSSAANMIK